MHTSLQFGVTLHRAFLHVKFPVVPISQLGENGCVVIIVVKNLLCWYIFFSQLILELSISMFTIIM